MSESAPIPDRTELVEHVEFIRALARRLVGETGAGDVAQDAAVAALTARTEARSGLRPWLVGVVRNLSRRSARTAVRRRAREAAVARPEAAESAVDAAARLEISRRVVDAVASLDEPYRSTVVRRFYDDLSSAEISRRDGVPAATARTRLRRGLALLRNRLDAGHGGDRRVWTLALAPLAIPTRERARTDGRKGILVRTLVGVAALAVVVVLGLLAGGVVGGEPGPTPSPEARRAPSAQDPEPGADPVGDPVAEGTEDEPVARPAEPKPPPVVVRGGPGGGQIPLAPAVPIRVLGPDGQAVPRAVLFVFEVVPGGIGGGLGGGVVDGKAEFRPPSRWSSDLLQAAQRYYLDVHRARDADGQDLPLGPRLVGPVDLEGGEIRVELPPQRTAEGVVVDGEGRGVQGVRVRAEAEYPEFPEASRRAMRMLPAHAEAVTDAAGRFRLGQLGDRRYRLAVAHSAGWRPPSPVAFDPGATDVRVVLEPAPVIELTLVDGSGNPVPRALVSLMQFRPQVRSLHGRPTETPGVYRIPGLDPAQTYRLEVRSLVGGRPGPPVVRKRWKPASERIVLGASASRVLTVEVRTEDGGAVPGARVSYGPPEGERRRTIVADGEGNARIADAEPGDLVVRAGLTMAPPFLVAGEPRRVPATETKVRLVLPPGETLEVRFDGATPAHAAVIHVAPTGTAHDARWAIDGPGEDGVYRLRGIRPEAARSLTVYAFRADDDRSCALRKSVRAGAKPVVLRFEPGETIRGRILLPEGAEAERVWARAFGNAQPGVIGQDGTFRIPRLPTGRYRVTATALIDGKTVRKEVEAGTDGEVVVDFR